MVQINSDMNAGRYLEFLKRLAVFIPGGAPSLADPVYIEVQTEFFHENLFRFTAREFKGLLKTLPKTEKVFPPPMVILSTLVDLRLSQTVGQAWVETQKVVTSYKTDPHNHRTCSELLARTINAMGGLEALSKHDLRFLRKDFEREYDRLKVEFIEEDFNGNASGNKPTLVGNRLAVDHGSPDHLCLPAPDSVVKASEREETTGPEEPTEPVKSLLARLKDETSAEEPVVDRGAFGDRLYKIAVLKGWTDSDEVPQSFGTRNLNDMEQRALGYCLEHNPKLRGKVLAKPERGWFQTPNNGPAFEKFDLDQDPLMDNLKHGFMLTTDQEQYTAQRMAEKNPEKAEIYKRKLSERYN